MNTPHMKNHAFTLLELVVAVVILGVLAAMAIPRFSQGASRTNDDDLRAELTRLRTALELYYQDHGVYPAQRSAGTPTAAAGTAAAFVRQLTQYTDADGQVSATPSETFRYGPYLRDGVPPCPVSTGSPIAEVYLISGTAVPGYREAAGDTGWVYNYETGYIAANSPGIDAHGVRYDTY